MVNSFVEVEIDIMYFHVGKLPSNLGEHFLADGLFSPD